MNKYKPWVYKWYGRPLAALLLIFIYPIGSIVILVHDNWKEVSSDWKHLANAAFGRNR